MFNWRIHIICARVWELKKSWSNGHCWTRKEGAYTVIGAHFDRTMKEKTGITRVTSTFGSMRRGERWRKARDNVACMPDHSCDPCQQHRTVRLQSTNTNLSRASAFPLSIWLNATHTSIEKWITKRRLKVSHGRARSEFQPSPMATYFFKIKWWQFYTKNSSL